MSESVSLPKDRRQEVTIRISDDSLWIDFRPPLVAEAHKPSRVEIMAAAALVGIARALTGKGADQVIDLMSKFERDTARGRKK